MIRIKCFHGTSYENAQSILKEQHFRHSDGYAILSCDIECKEEEYLDLYDPEVLETFHEMRYYILNKSLSVDKSYKYKNAAVADTQVFNVIRKLRNVSVIRCPQFFGMFAEEQKFVFTDGRQFPKTYVPNVIMACVDTNKAVVKNIEFVEGGLYSDEYAGIV